MTQIQLTAEQQGVVGRKAHHIIVKAFSGTGNKEILSLVSVVKEYRGSLPGVIPQVSGSACDSPEEADQSVPGRPDRSRGRNARPVGTGGGRRARKSWDAG